METGQLKNRVWRLMRNAVGDIKEGDLELREETISTTLGENEFLLKTIYLSVDPTNRIWMGDVEQYMPPMKIGDVMRGLNLLVVVKSNTPQYTVGDIVTGMGGFQEYVLGKAVEGQPPAFIKLDTQVTKKLNQPLTLFMSVLGMIGITAYFGLLDITNPKAGETVVVSAAGGATGSLVGQIAKVKGCRVIGIAGTEDKCKWIVDELGFDAAINYKTENVSESLKKHCPSGIDIYFESVGGKIFDAVLPLMNRYGRISVCGLISQYNSLQPHPIPTELFHLILVRRLKIQGFICFDYYPRMSEALRDLSQWIAEGKIKDRVTVVNGFENALKAINMLFTGDNIGKLLVKVSSEP